MEKIRQRVQGIKCPWYKWLLKGSRETHRDWGAMKYEDPCTASGLGSPQTIDFFIFFIIFFFRSRGKDQSLLSPHHLLLTAAVAAGGNHTL